MPNFLTGSPSQSTATSKGVASTLDQVLQGLMNTGPATEGYWKGKYKKGQSTGDQFTANGGFGVGGFTDPGNVLAPGLGQVAFGGKGGSKPKWVPGKMNRDMSMAALSFDPDQIKQTTTALGRFSAPDYLSGIADDPYVKALMASTTDQHNENLQKNLASTRSQFALHGQTGGETASPVAQAQGQAVEDAQKDLSAIIASELFGEYQNRENLQIPGISAANQFNMLPVNILASLAPLLSKSKGATPSPLAAISQLVGAVGGAAEGVTGALGACWVAREVFGTRNPKWIRFRYWMMNKAPKWFKGLYLVRGEAFASWLREHTWCKPAVKCLMERAI